MDVSSVCFGSNAELIAQVCRLYLPNGGRVADVTYGKGVFWRKAPQTIDLVGSDLEPHNTDAHQVLTADFRDLPHDDHSFDVAVIDPPYVHSPGKHVTDTRYNNASTTGGMSHDSIIQLYADGMAECRRIVNHDGQVWVKCKDQIESGKQRWSHVDLLNVGQELGMYARDLFVLLPLSLSPTGRWDVQLHARKHHSFLWVFDAWPNERSTLRPADRQVAPADPIQGSLI